MRKRPIIWFHLLTLAVALVLAAFVHFTIKEVNGQVERQSYNLLSQTARQLARNFLDKSQADSALLKTMAVIIANGDTADRARLQRILRAFGERENELSYVELLDPDNTVMGSDGIIRDARGLMDFGLEALKGSHITNIERGSLDGQERVVRIAEPVIRDGETIFMLYEVLRLSELAQWYRTDIYGGQAHAYLMDGSSGDFLLDTWHDSLGNINDFADRTVLPGYSFAQTFDALRRGEGGHLGLVSRTTGTVLYLSYEPVGINNWSAMISVEQQYAFDESRAVRSSLYRMAIVISGVVFLYMTIVTLSLLRATRRLRKAGMEDQTTQLPNRNAFDQYLLANRQKTFASLTCVYVDANGLHALNNVSGHAAGDRMLRVIADTLKGEFAGMPLFRVGGDEFVVLCEQGDRQTCADRMARALKAIEAQNYSISYGIVHARNETGIERIAQAADEKMLEHKRDYYIRHDRRRK